MNPLLTIDRSCARAISDAVVVENPFPHLIIEEFLPGSCLQEAIGEACGIDLRRNYGVARNRRCEFRKLAFFPHEVGEILNQISVSLSSPLVVNAIGRKLNYRGLVADPTYYGGGIHMTMRGGFLGIHRDFNIHQELNLKRVANLILFLNQDWKEEYGGHLVLQGKPQGGDKKAVLPIANRAVIFDTAAENSYHGQPEPLRAPYGTNRLSLALYYYKSLENQQIQARGTDFVELRGL